MIRVKDLEVSSKEVYEFLKILKEQQKTYSSTSKIVYPKISLYLALKNKIFYAKLLTHPLILKEKKFYEDKKQIEDELSLKEELVKVLEYEMSDKGVLPIEERTHLIKLFSKLQKKFEKESADI
jgi:hypothetical protein